MLRPSPLALLASLALLLPLPAPAQSSAPAAVITLEPWRTRWVVTATVGGAPRRYLFDTGGGITSLSAAAATAAGCRPWGRLTGYNMFGRRGDSPRCDGVSFEVGGRSYAPPATGLIDMAKLNPRDSALDGLIALDMFADRAITLDLAAGRIVVESEASLAERVRDMTPLPIRVNREASGFALAVLAAVPSERGTLWMELDSGNGGTILVSKPVASLVGLDSAVAGKQHAEFAVAGGARVRSDDGYAPDMTMDGNLGMPFLRHWLVTLDLRTQRAWIRPAVSAAPNESGARAR